MKEKRVILKKSKEAIIKRKHPWIFSGAIQAVDHQQIANGDVVSLYSHKDEFFCKAHYQDASISLRVLTYENVEINKDFYRQKLSTALNLRKALIDEKVTNAYRWVHGEGDGLPGLIVDYYNGHVILELHSLGMYNDRELIAAAIALLLPDVKTIYASIPSILKHHSVQESHYLKGHEEQTTILENGHSFIVNWKEGQKTGFFLDQRENRGLLGSLSKSKTILNLFSYSGGFSIYALMNGAKMVHSVDSSDLACEMCQDNTALNQIDTQRHIISKQDIMRDSISDDVFDIVVVDPPAFAKNVKKRHQAVQAYKRLNQKALQYVKPGGFLMTFSCSQVVGPKLFADTIRSAFIESQTYGQVLKHLEQGGDHPVAINHPEGHYLKGLLIRKQL